MAENKPSKCKGTCGKRRVLNEQGLCRECAASAAIGHFDAEPRAAQFLEPPAEQEGHARGCLSTVQHGVGDCKIVESLPEDLPPDAEVRTFAVSAHRDPSRELQPDELPRSIREIREVPKFTGNSRDRRRQRRAWERQTQAQAQVK